MACDLDVALWLVAPCNFASRFDRLDATGVEDSCSEGVLGKAMTLDVGRRMADVSCRRT